MISVMIVEDEPPIAASIKWLAEGHDKRLKVVHTAINGKRALEYLDENHVDIVFSDIKMPIMDGLELARLVQAQYPWVVVIIVSGFQEFEFAQKAIRYGVSNYLLKPVSGAHMAEVLEPAICEVLERQRQRTRSILENAVMNEAGQDDLAAGQRCGVVLIYGGAYPLIPDNGMLDIHDIWSVDAVEDMLMRCLSDEESGVCARGRNPLEIAVIFYAGNESRIQEVARELFRELKRDGKIPITLAAWEKLSPLGNLRDVLSSLRKRIYKEIRLFDSRLIIGREPEKSVSAWDSEACQASLLIALKTKRPESIRSGVEALVSSAVSQSAKQLDLELCLEKILLRYFDSLYGMDRIGEIKFDVQSAISTSMHPHELVEELSGILYSWAQFNESQKQDSDQLLCEEIARYLRQRYKENIRGSDLARHFGYSSTQLAKKFKSHYGISISEFVNNFRIDLAQTIMSANKKAMIKEVAMDVGYNDQYYFSKLFKKITGVWPTEYQRRL